MVDNKVQVIFTFEEVKNKQIPSGEGCELKSSVKVSRSIVGFDPDKNLLAHPCQGYALVLANSGAIDELIHKEFAAMVKKFGGKMMGSSCTDILPDDTNLH